MSQLELLTPVDCAPLATLYHENSKLSVATERDLAESIAEFAADPDEIGRAATATKTYANSRRVELSQFADRRRCDRPFHRVLAERRTVRDFAEASLSLAEIGALLEHACGVTGETSVGEIEGLKQQLRAAPSGGALYPIETYLVALDVEGLDGGVYHYHPVARALETVCSSATRDQFAPLVITAPGPPLSAPALLVLSARWERVLAKYGERGYRNLLLDAGHSAQNLLLTATALGLAACPLGGFYDDRLASALQLDPCEEPVLYAIMVGKPAT
jgi:SagB-type dehydrogenase family enzyme